MLLILIYITRSCHQWRVVFAFILGWYRARILDELSLFPCTGRPPLAPSRLSLSCGRHVHISLPSTHLGSLVSPAWDRASVTLQPYPRSPSLIPAPSPPPPPPPLPRERTVREDTAAPAPEVYQHLQQAVVPMEKQRGPPSLPDVPLVDPFLVCLEDESDQRWTPRLVRVESGGCSQSILACGSVTAWTAPFLRHHRSDQPSERWGALYRTWEQRTSPPWTWYLLYSRVTHQSSHGIPPCRLLFSRPPYSHHAGRGDSRGPSTVSPSLSLQLLLPPPGSKVLPFDRGVRQRPQTLPDPALTELQWPRSEAKRLTLFQQPHGRTLGCLPATGETPWQ